MAVVVRDMPDERGGFRVGHRADDPKHDHGQWHVERGADRTARQFTIHDEVDGESLGGRERARDSRDPTGANGGISELRKEAANDTVHD